MSDDRHDRVSRRAYELWEEQGGEHGRHEDHWHRASAEVDGSREEPAITAPDGTTLNAPTETAAETAAKPARKRAAPKAAETPAAPVDKAPAKPRKPKAK